MVLADDGSSTCGMFESNVLYSDGHICLFDIRLIPVLKPLDDRVTLMHAFCYNEWELGKPSNFFLQFLRYQKSNQNRREIMRYSNFFSQCAYNS